MAIIIKTAEQIARLREAGRIVAETYEELRPYITPGVTTGELDARAEAFIRGKGAQPMYKGHGAVRDRAGRVVRPPFPATICVAINDVVCHGIPSPRQTLQEGDLVGIDIGARYRGWIGDSCVTFAVGKLDDASQRLLDVTRRCLEIGIAQARPGGHIGDIGAAIQTYAEGEGFSVVRDLGGHGVGRELWEEPFVPHYGARGSGALIRPGMVFTIEPMINAGVKETKTSAEDGWTISTADGKRSAQFEHSLAITEDGVEILTTL
ncbi:MAG: type I methionyl aminopeptidase [Chloroflexota bacterium]|nr:type I methionyl aminopeptidase [Chloroflexota bacterium]